MEQTIEAVAKLKEELYPQLKEGIENQVVDENTLEPIREDSELDVNNDEVFITYAAFLIKIFFKYNFI